MTALLLPALVVWVLALRLWMNRYMPVFLLAAAQVLEREPASTTPVSEPRRLRASDLTVRDTGWATKDYPTVAYELVAP